MASGSGGEKSGLPYRPCVGIILVNRHGKVLMGWRKDFVAKDSKGHHWQMPQGGIDKGEKPKTAALRELFEETNVSSIKKIAKSRVWHEYDLPPERLGKAFKGRYRGQRQKWFVFAFEGDDSEIDVAQPGGGRHKAEFSAWKWVDFEQTVALIIPFKRHVYEALVEEFGSMIAAMAEVE